MRYVRSGQDAGMAVYADANVLEAAVQLLSKVDGRLLIVVEDGVDADEGKVEGHPLVQAVRKLKDQGRMKGQFEIRQASEAQVQKMRDEGVYHHMMLMDSQAYRVETDRENVGAFVNANDEENVVPLINIFHRMLYRDAQSLCLIEP